MWPQLRHQRKRSNVCALLKPGVPHSIRTSRLPLLVVVLVFCPLHETLCAALLPFSLPSLPGLSTLRARWMQSCSLTRRSGAGRRGCNVGVNTVVTSCNCGRSAVFVQRETERGTERQRDRYRHRKTERETEAGRHRSRLCNSSLTTKHLHHHNLQSATGHAPPLHLL